MPVASPTRKLLRTFVPRGEVIKLDRLGVKLKLTPRERRWAAFYMSDPRRDATEAARKAGSANATVYAKLVVKRPGVLTYLDEFEKVMVGHDLPIVEIANALATIEETRRHATEGMVHTRLGIYVKPNGAVDLEAIRKAPAGAVVEYEVIAAAEGDAKLEGECSCGKVVTLPARIRFKVGNHHSYTSLNGRFLGLDKGRPVRRTKVIDQSKTLNLNFERMPPDLAMGLRAWIAAQEPELPPAEGEAKP